MADRASKLIKSYQKPKLPSLQLGEIVLDEKVLKNAPVDLVLTSLNRHGLIAGSTGSGKTKTMQVLCEQLSLAGCPCLVMDIKGDISGLAYPGEHTPKLSERAQSMGLTYAPRSFPVELYSLDEHTKEIPLRTSVDDFGALLFARMLALNETQRGVLTVLFVYAKNQNIPLLDLENLKEILRFAQSDAGKKAIEVDYGNIAATSIGAILRKIIALEAQGAQSFFGKPAFKVTDLLRTNANGLGVISIVRLMQMQDKPQIFSTFMLKFLTDVYAEFPELGDLPKPKLVIFLDEAHLIFNNANKALLNLLETTVKLIRSKGVGIIFCTQSPDDIPDDILSQLGLKIQHSLRAFTAKDRQDLKLVAQNFPPSEFYNIEGLLTSLGIGEVLVSALDAKGMPTPLAQCKVRPPESRMGVISDKELLDIVNVSTLFSKYSERAEHKNATLILNKNIGLNTAQSSGKWPAEGYADSTKSKKKVASRTTKDDTNLLDNLSKNTLVRQIVRDFFKWILKSWRTKK